LAEFWRFLKNNWRKIVKIRFISEKNAIKTEKSLRTGERFGENLAIFEKNGENLT